MSSTPLSAGDYIAANCSKCRQQTNHTVIAMIGDVPAKVQCNICGGEHKYRKPAAPKTTSARGARSTAAPRRSKSDPQAAARQQWEQQQESFDASKARPYGMDDSYRAGDLVQHPSFGLGKVQEMAGSRKMAVLFADGVKVLRCK